MSKLDQEHRAIAEKIKNNIKEANQLLREANKLAKAGFKGRLADVYFDGDEDDDDLEFDELRDLQEVIGEIGWQSSSLTC